MSQSLFPILFAAYWCSVLLWCLMADHLCRSLRSRHPLLYEALGRPALAVGGAGGLRNEWALLRFLIGRRDRFVEDDSLIRLCGAMRFLLLGYALFFLSLPGLLSR